MHFYSLSDEQILRMPVRRFWVLEAQINRILSERDLRLINVDRASGSQEQMSQVIDRLIFEIGETCKVERLEIVQARPEDKEKLKALFG